jgi:signal transduction histidine kinase
MTALDETDHVKLSVQDAGVGIAPGEAEKLFDAFFTTKKSGMGIGLSVSRSIVEGHRGRLWAEPNKDHGAIFSLSIPVNGRQSVSPADAVEDKQIARNV